MHFISEFYFWWNLSQRRQRKKWQWKWLIMVMVMIIIILQWMNRCFVCYGNFNVPCHTSCSHWFRGECILHKWLHGFHGYMASQWSHMNIHSSQISGSMSCGIGSWSHHDTKSTHHPLGDCHYYYHYHYQPFLLSFFSLSSLSWVSPTITIH